MFACGFGLAGEDNEHVYLVRLVNNRTIMNV